MREINYQIIITSHNKQIEFIKSFTTESKANKYFYKMIKENEKVVFPVNYINCRKIMEAKYELVIIKKRKNGEDSVTRLKNDYGEYVDNETNNENWVVYDKSPYYFEETFWVYGFHPLNHRKDFNYIYNDLVKPRVTNKYDFLQFFIFKNKLVMKTYDKTDMVICKNKSDCIRLYNKIKENCEKDRKIKYYMFCGDWGIDKGKRKDAIDIIKNLTNWNDLKINRKCTRP